MEVLGKISLDRPLDSKINRPVLIKFKGDIQSKVVHLSRLMVSVST